MAWVALPNHYHSILKAPDEDASQLPELLASAQKFTALSWNCEDGMLGRQVWYQYRDTCLSYPGSCWARLNYIHHNPVKHGLCNEPGEYPFSSYHVWRQLEEVDLFEVEGAYHWDRLNLE